MHLGFIIHISSVLFTFLLSDQVALCNRTRPNTVFSYYLIFIFCLFLENYLTFLEIQGKAVLATAYSLYLSHLNYKGTLLVTYCLHPYGGL